MGAPIDAAEIEVVHVQSRQPLAETQFVFLTEHGGQAFVDICTCLNAPLDPVEPPMMLRREMGHCAQHRQGRANGGIGWQLPAMGELTSRDFPDEYRQHNAFGQSQRPPHVRSEAPFWTSTEWLGAPGSAAGVILSDGTAKVTPILTTDSNTGVGCVSAFQAPAVE